MNTLFYFHYVIITHLHAISVFCNDVWATGLEIKRNKHSFIHAWKICSLPLRQDLDRKLIDNKNTVLIISNCAYNFVYHKYTHVKFQTQILVSF